MNHVGNCLDWWAQTAPMLVGSNGCFWNYCFCEAKYISWGLVQHCSCGRPHRRRSGFVMKGSRVQAAVEASGPNIWPRSLPKSMFRKPKMLFLLVTGLHCSIAWNASLWCFGAPTAQTVEKTREWSASSQALLPTRVYYTGPMLALRANITTCQCFALWWRQLTGFYCTWVAQK